MDVGQLEMAVRAELLGPGSPNLGVAYDDHRIFRNRSAIRESNRSADRDTGLNLEVADITTLFQTVEMIAIERIVTVHFNIGQWFVWHKWIQRGQRDDIQFDCEGCSRDARSNQVAGF